MSTALYREFRLTGANAWSAVLAFVKANAKVFAERGEPLRLIVTAEEKQRNSAQNKFYWGAVLRQISEQGWVAGKQFSKDAWHEYFARTFGVCEDIVLPDGEIVVRRKSTTTMTVGEFTNYLNQIQAYAATDLGIEFDQWH